jgi:predicted Zn-dependent peptidase
MAMSLSASAPAQVPAGHPAAPTTTYKMSNGMDVILKENHSSPMISSVVFVRSGAKYETDFNNGATHFLEHLLFNGTATRTQEEISNRIKNLGGYINAFTRKELTAYMSLVPSEYIAEALDIQQDMLFSSIFPEERFPKERKIVIEEIRKDTDNPEYVAEQFYDRWAYHGSPYSRPVLGYENLIATIPRQEVIDYYHTYYQPNNMIILVIGDFETSAMKALLEETFGRHRAQPIPPRPAIKIPAIQGRAIKRTEADIAETHLDLHFRLPSFSDPSYYPMTLLTEILNERALSPLRKKLTEGDNPPATRVSAFLETQEEFCALHLSVITDDPERTEEIIGTIEKVLRGLPSLEVAPDDIQAIVTRLKVEDIFLREKLHYYAIMKAPMLVVTGYEFMDELPDNLSRVTLADVREAASRYLTADDYVATIVVPRRDEPGEAAPAVSASHSVFSRRTLSNGVTAIVKSNPDSRVFAVNVLGKGRATCEPEGLAGISDFVNRMLTSGTYTRSADDLSRGLTAIGADLTTNDNPYIPYDDRYTTPQYTFIKFATIDEYAAQGAELLADMLDHSAFPEDEVAKTQKQVLGFLGMSAGSTRDACRGLFYESLFGDAPYARPVMGSHESVMRFNSEELERHLHTLYSPKNIIVTCVTNFDVVHAYDLLEGTLGQMSAGTPPDASVSRPPAPQGEVASNKPMEKEQVYIYLGGLLPGAVDADAAAIQVAARILSSRLAAELREKQGLAYSVGASVSFDREFGWHVCAMGTGRANYTRAKEGILAEIRRLQEELPAQEEVEIAQNSIWGSTLTAQLSRINQAYYMGVHEFLGLGYDHGERLAGQVRAVRPADVQRVARTYFDTENYILATAGNHE